MPAHAQISILIWMPLLPGGAVMTLSAILLTTKRTNCLLHEYDIQIKLLIENKLIICALGNLHCKISREKFEPEPGFEPRTSGFLAQRSTTWFWFKFLS